MSEAQGQAETQPALSALNPSEAVALLAQQIEEDSTPRNEKGQFSKTQPEAEAAQPETEAPEATEEVAEEAAPEPEVDAEAKQESRRLKLKYKGEEKEVDEAEAVELAQKGYDYTQKSQALAKEREELAAKAKAAEDQARQKYEQELATLREATLKLVDQEAMTADLNKLALEDPARAQQLFFRKLQIQQTLQQVAAAQNQVVQQRQMEMQEISQKQAREAVERLQTDIVGWNNDLYGKILKHAVDSEGFKPEEVNAITDHRAIKVLHKARLYDELMAAKPKTVEKRVASVPKVTKPGTTEKANPRAEKLKESMAALNKTGSKEAAADVFRTLIEQGRL